MRLYAKLLVMILLFAAARQLPVREAASEIAYQARVKLVLGLGTQADYDALIEDTQRMLAAQGGRLDVYLAGRRYRELLAERMSAAARRNVSLSEDDLVRLQAECRQAAFGANVPAFYGWSKSEQLGEIRWSGHRSPSP